MIFNLLWIPEFSYIENKIRSPFNLNKSLNYIKQNMDTGVEVIGLLLLL